jgi:transposase
MEGRSLTPEQRLALERQLQEARDARVYRRTLAVLECSRGRSIVEIADTLGVTRQTVYNWLETFSRTCDAGALCDARRPGRPRAWTEEGEAALRALLETSPDRLGHCAVNWTVPLMQDQLERTTGHRLSDDTIRRELQRQGYVWKRPRYVLEPDPDLEKKTLDSASPARVVAGERAVGGG